MASQITASLPTLAFPKEADYPTQEDWAAFSAAAELNFGILGGSWSTQMQQWKNEADYQNFLNNIEVQKAGEKVLSLNPKSVLMKVAFVS